MQALRREGWKLLADLRDRLARAADGAHMVDQPVLDEEERARLRSLGYVH